MESAENITLINQALYGALFMAALAVGLFFHRFWRASRDRLFLLLALAFWMLAAERVGAMILPMSFGPTAEEGRPWIFLLRLVAFLLIILGILDKNRGARASSTRPPD